MRDIDATTGPDAADLAVLESIQRRLLWLAVRIVDSANHDRPADQIKVGGHQASSASMVGIMTALWFGHLSGADKVAVKPHASPLYHAIKYLTGELDRAYLTRLREFGGLQAYPSRTKDPDVADFSTGSVGLGVVAPLFAAAARRYTEAHFGPAPGPRPRFVALAGDAELDEGNVWEAIADPALQDLGNVMWVIDTNRQSLDRVVPEQKVKKLINFFHSAGWHVVEAKYGALLAEAFALPGGELLREHLDAMPNEHFQSLFALKGGELRGRFLVGARPELARFVERWDDEQLRALVTNLGGHDLRVLIDAYAECDAVSDRPSVVFAYTVKGWGLPIAGDPLNHSALLSKTQVDELRAELGLTPDTEWDRFPDGSAEQHRCAALGDEVNNRPPAPRPALAVPTGVGPTSSSRPTSSQEAFGRLLVRLAAEPQVAPRLVTTSPDVSVSTNLGGWINKVGVFEHRDVSDFGGSGGALRWTRTASGQHVELGISEMNLFLMLHALGLAHELHGEHLLPVGTVYDPFICRGLDALIYALYNGARFVVAGTPAGVTLGPEGGAHQSSITPSIGLELPGLDYAEPAYARALDWLLCDGLAGLARPDGASLYVRLSTRPIDQRPFDQLAAVDPERLRSAVLAGGYRLREPVGGRGHVVLATCGAVVPEVLDAARLLDDEGVSSVVLELTSPGRLYAGWRASLRAAGRAARRARGAHQIARLLAPSERALPIVTVHDAASHHLAWLGSVYGTPVVPVGVDEFGQSGAIAALYDAFDLSAERIVNAALVAIDQNTR